MQIGPFGFGLPYAHEVSDQWLFGRNNEEAKAHRFPFSSCTVLGNLTEVDVSGCRASSYLNSFAACAMAFDRVPGTHWVSLQDVGAWIKVRMTSRE